MNDRFTFRVWIKYSRKMAAVHVLNLDRERVIARLESNLYPEYQLHEVELMQCTGLKDKNGQLIFEGDILLIHDDEYGKIEFEEAGFRLTIDNVTSCLSEFYSYELEIAGNIYENPELLGIQG